MTEVSSLRPITTALTADVLEVFRASERNDFVQASHSENSLLVTRLVQLTMKRGARIEQLVVAITRSWDEVPRPSEIANQTWEGIPERLLANCIRAFVSARGTTRDRMPGTPAPGGP